MLLLGIGTKFKFNRQRVTVTAIKREGIDVSNGHKSFFIPRNKLPKRFR